MAEAIARHRGPENVKFYSAGTHLAHEVNPLAIKTVKALFNVDMDTETYYPKTLQDIPGPDVVITMGCGVQCPIVPSRHREDWNLEDPSGKDEAFFASTSQEISEKVDLLLRRIEAGEFK